MAVHATQRGSRLVALLLEPVDTPNQTLKSLPRWDLA